MNESSQIYKRLVNSNDIHRHPNNNNNSCSSSHASIKYHNSFPSTIQPIPISPFDHRKQLSISTSPTSTSTSSLILQPNLPRISTISSNLTSTPTTKHFTPKSLHPLSCSPTTSSNCNGNRYQCQYCSKRFSRPSSLRIHTYSHTGEKPFVCSEPGCGRKFSVQSNMRRHLRVHKLGRPVKKTRYDGEVEGVKMLSPAKITRNYL
nr:1063_t:CDS:2 [Entrophospora candida]CAG8606048.1 12530_t:CDS:2 [Entrophospora candida]